MIKSGLFLRTLTLVMATILLSAVLIMALFVPLSRRQISSIRATELELKANYLADEYVRYNRGLQSHESFRLRVGSNSAWGASAMVFKYDGTLDVYTIPNDTEKAPRASAGHARPRPLPPPFRITSPRSSPSANPSP